MLLNRIGLGKFRGVARAAKKKMKNLDFKQNLDLNSQKIKRKQTIQDIDQFQNYVSDSIINNQLSNKISKASR